MALSDRIDARQRQPTITMRLAGRRVSAVLEVNTDQEFGQSVAGGTVVIRDPPVTPAPGMAISWTWGYDGEEIAGFTGTVTDPRKSSYPDRWTLEVKDVLGRAARTTGSIAVSPLNSVTATDSIEYILETYGGDPATDIPDIKRPSDSGTSWTLGQLTPIAWSRTSALAAAAEIAATAGYWLYADPGGVVRARQLERKPSASPFRTLRRGDAAGATLLQQGAPTRARPGDQVKNKVTVRGASTGVEGAQLWDTYQATHAVYPGEIAELELSFFLLEYIADVTAVAERVTALYNRAPNIITARIKADPRIAVGATVAIEDAGVGFASATPFFVYKVSTTFNAQEGRFDQTLTLDGGTGSSGFSLNPAPEAAFQYDLVAETVDGDAVVEVFLDGTGSRSLAGGEIVSYSWTTATTTHGGTPSSASGPLAMFVFDASAGTASITLTVTDTNSKTNTLTRVVSLAASDAGPPVKRLVSIAFGAAWEVTPDGGATWREETSAGDAVAVPPIGPGVDLQAPAGDGTTYGIIATRGSGGTGVRRSLDGLASASAALASIGTAIACLWQNERNGSRVWAAAGDTIYRSTDGGATFTAMAKPAAGVNVAWVIEDPAVDNSVFALAGNVLYNATDPTLGWAVLFTGPTGATGRQFVRSRDGGVTWVCYSNSAQVDRVEGGTVTIAGASGVRTLALGPSPDYPLYIFDDQRKIWTASGLTGGTATESAATLPSGATAMHANHDPEYPIVYVADFDSVASGTGAVRKFLPRADALLPFRLGATGRQAHMIGFGTPAAGGVGKIYMLPAQTGANNKLWIYDLETGAWDSKALPETDVVTWHAVTASPFDPRRLLLEKWSWNTVTVTGNSTIYVSTDGGDSWDQLFDETVRQDLYRHRAPAQWSRQSGDRWIGIWHSTTPTNRLLRGTLTGYSTQSIPTLERFHATPMLAEEALIHGLDSPYVRRALDGGTVSTSVASGWEAAVDTMYDSLINSAKTVQAYYVSESSGTLKIASDYRSGSASTLIGTASAGGWAVAVLADETVVIGGRGSILEVPTAWSGGSPSAVYTSSIGWVRTDRQTQTVAAATDTTAGVGNVIPLVRDPSSRFWRPITRPAGVEFTDWIEVTTEGA